MALLWTQAVQHEGMAWYQDPDSIVTHQPHHILPVKKAGFASYTADKDWEDEMQEGREDHGEEHDDFDDDLYESARPEPTPEEEAHNEEHGEYPEEYQDRHYKAYGEALDRKREEKRAENEPDHDDPDLIRFVGNHGTNTDLWRRHGTFGDVDLTKGVHATQSHVSQAHIDRYLADPDDATESVQQGRGQNSGYLGDEAPMFVTHHGALHTTEGHHRVAAALQRGDKSMKGWHYDLDKDPALTKPQYEDWGDETWTSPHDMDPKDREHYESMRDD